MKKYLHLTIFLTATLLVVALFAVALPAQAQTQTTLQAQTLYNVNIRTAPGTNRSIIDVLPATSEFTAIGRNAENTWVQVEFEETVGWSAAWLLVFEKDTIELPVTTDVEAPPATDPGPFDTLIPFNMNVREYPDVNSAEIDEIPFLTDATAVARDESNSWVQIEYGRGNTGWVALWKIVLLGDVGELPVANLPPPTATPVSTQATQETVTTEQVVFELEEPNVPDCKTLTVGVTSTPGFFEVQSVDPSYVYFDAGQAATRVQEQAYFIDRGNIPMGIGIYGQGEATASDCDADTLTCTTVTFTMCAQAVDAVGPGYYISPVTLQLGHQSYTTFYQDSQAAIEIPTAFDVAN